MERYAWKGYVKEGCLQEYKRRHDEIWPEMTALLNQAGIRNYSIWNIGNELFGYYECDSVERALAVQAESPVVKRWDAYMADILTMETDEQGRQAQLKQMFLHKGEPAEPSEG